MMGRQSAQEDLFYEFRLEVMSPTTTFCAGLVRC